jgi:RNA polymerase sigma factor for flagellar operon FliA
MATKSEDQEIILQFFSTRDPALREKLVLRYVPLVHYALGRLGLSMATTPDYDDAVSQGLLALIDAVDRYNPSHGAQFSTYAILRVRGGVLDYLRSQDWLSRSARKRTRQLQNATNDMWQRLGRMPSENELAEQLGLSMTDLQRAMVDASTVMVSLDQMGEGGDDEEVTLHEVLADDKQLDPSSAFDEQELGVNLLSAIKSLPEREQLVLSLYYYEELTLKEIGEVLQVSESRVCQLHARAMMTLRAGFAQGRSPRRDTEYTPPASPGYPVPSVYDYDYRR